MIEGASRTRQGQHPNYIFNSSSGKGVKTVKLTIPVLAGFVWFVLLLGSGMAPIAPHAVAHTLASSVYLPLVIGGSGDSVPGGDDAARFWLPFQTADNTPVTLYGPTVAVDGNGGIHIAYTIRAGQDAGHRPAYYYYCPANCSNPGQWSRSRVGDNIADARIALDALGHPRIMLFSDLLNLGPGVNHFYQYAACDHLPCTGTGDWQIGTILQVNDLDPTRMDRFHRYFALNPQGQPGFVYHDWNASHTGTFYRYCTSVPQQCTNPANWSEWRMNPGYLPDPLLAYTRQGEPRFLTSDISDPTTTRLLYVECDPGCATRANWAYLTVLGPFSTYEFAITSSGDPRIMLYTGDPTTNQSLQTNQLYYIWCQNGCTDTDASNWGVNWYGYPIGTHPYFGMTVSLVLDAADRPHLAYQMGDEGGPGYTWCTGTCETAPGSAGWQRSVVVDTSAELNQDWPVIPQYNCTISTWTSGQRPWLALDPRTGAPRISYEASHVYGGYDLDHPGQSCPAMGDIFLARIALLNP
jgi:hypothetical protein